MSSRPSHTLSHFFSGLTENTFFTRFGVADPPLVDYLSDMLLRFVRLDAVHKVRSTRGRRLSDLMQMMAEAEQRVGLAKRDVHRHIGDFALFWTGLFPEALRPRGSSKHDFFLDYCAQGKRAYLIASQIETDREEDAPGELLERLGRQFELCAYGLREVRREWEQNEDDGETPNPYLFN